MWLGLLHPIDVRQLHVENNDIRLIDLNGGECIGAIRTRIGTEMSVFQYRADDLCNRRLVINDDNVRLLAQQWQ